MSDNKRPTGIQKFFWSSSSIVWLAGILVATAMGAQAYVLEVYEMTLNLPHQALTWSFAIIVSGYAGTDRIAAYMKTQSMEYGTVDIGNPAKLRKVILLTVLLLALGVSLTIVYGVQGLPLEALATAFGGVSTTYIIGNKSLRGAASQEGTHNIEEQPHFYSDK